MSFDLGNAVDSYHAQCEGVTQIWGFFGLMVIGLVTITWTAATPVTDQAKRALLVCFGVLALGNLVVVCRAQAQAVAMLDAIKSYVQAHPEEVPNELQKGIKNFGLSRGVLVAVAHLAIDVATAIIVWLR